MTFTDTGKLNYLLKSSLKKERKNWKKLCSDLGSNRGAVEPSVGSLTRCLRAIEAFKKIQKKNCLIFYGQKHVTCSLWDSWLVATIWEPEFWLAIKKKPGNIVGELENYDFRTRYIKREHMWIIIILVWNNVPSLKTGIITTICKIEVYIENFRTRHSSVGNCFAISSSAALEQIK